MPRIRAASIDEHKALTRNSLLASAKGLIAEAGTAEIPLGEIALAAGVGRTTLYDYFVDRDDLIATLVEAELPGVIDRLIAGAPASGTAGEQLADLAGRTVEFVASDPVLGLILHREVGRMGPEAQERVRAAHSHLADAMMGLYHHGVRDGEFREMPPDLAGRLIQDTIMSAAKSVISARDPGERTPVVIVHLRHFLLGGLRRDR
ncbi:MAG TPA: TetR/AcrR family transcriptional regulator [Acidimicrobiia bacterium]|jgi:AcrR family transcriptional regulator|nr:TetR/AcrR family transcriptional regulator [Acidimicrobiia bacterium]